MIKRIRKYVLLFVLSVLFVGFLVMKQYFLVHDIINDKYYLLPLYEIVEEDPPGISSQRQVKALYFSSLDEMKFRIQHSIFSKDERIGLAEDFTHSYGRVCVFDLDNLYEMSLPADVSYSLVWNGRSYAHCDYQYKIKYASDGSGTVSRITAEQFAEKLEQDYQGGNIPTVTTDAERDNIKKQNTNKYYMLKSDNIHMYVKEDPWFDSDSEVHTYFIAYDLSSHQYFEGLLGVHEPFAIDWLLQFRISDYPTYEKEVTYTVLVLLTVVVITIKLISRKKIRKQKQNEVS